ncbi:TetR/AcrR family transcriptional regulator [Gordonia malaquae]|uniref:TetR/AcrR family transcriptional regulator n=1 Tax=Gordonia malaquae TaxID=410332 RepID=UPI00034BFCB3|nr:TetR/AcrR family transcriptional regulator [Gordonia malaquae]
MSDINRRRGRPPGPPLDRDARREALLDAAEDAIASSGPDVSLAEVARRAGLTRSAVYAAFADRDALLDALASRHAARLVESMRDVADSSATPRDQTRASVDLLAAWFESSPDLAGALAARWRTDGRSFVESMLADVLAAGFVARSLDPTPAPVWARAMVGAVSASVEWWSITRDISRDELVDHVTELLWSGLSAANP